MDKAFLYLASFFGNAEDRSLEELTHVYQDTSLLKNKIAGVLQEGLAPRQIYGKSVFLKPNWVKHSSVPTDEICLRTHDAFTLAVLEVVLEGKPKKVVIGDAPIQGCKWNDMISTSFLEEVNRLSRTFSIPVLVKDLRRVVTDFTKNERRGNQRSLEDFIIFDVGKKSYLEEITKPGKNEFRVTHYDPDRFIESHGPGKHQYCITKELFESDLVISLPKTKTHEKTGITNALKNIVGLNGDKDFLPHHRIGGTGQGGDSYPGKNILRYWSERLYDQANKNLGHPSYTWWVRGAALLWRLSFPGIHHRFGAGWYGNQTTWRMVMDLNLVARYGQADGTLSDQPVREVYSLFDGIIGGQKDGPLNPTPLALGFIGFTNDSALADIVMAELMGMKISKIPLLQAAGKSLHDKEIAIQLNQHPTHLETLADMRVKADMPAGWKNYEHQ